MGSDNVINFRTGINITASSKSSRAAGLAYPDSARIEELFNRYHSGDMDARGMLIEENIYLVLYKTLRLNSSAADDMFMIGCIGLIKAVDRYDNSIELPFFQYACNLIDSEINLYLSSAQMQG